MKTCILLSLSILTLGLTAVLSCVGQESKLRIMKIKYRVVDEGGKAVEGAEIHIACYIPRYDNNPGPEALTNAEGFAAVESPTSTGALEVSVLKKGYYSSSGLEVPFQKLDPGKPDAPEFMNLVMKKVGNPCAMYARNLMVEGGGPLKIPRKNQAAGYDLQAGDWVKPFGKGEVADLLFTEEGEEKYGAAFQYKLTVRFSNPKDGLIAFEAPQFKGSELRSDHMAPAEGYLPEWVQTSSGEAGKQATTTANKDRNFYLRVRSVTDKPGNLISACYGKIYGDFPGIIYYFNPSPNDRNVEFDKRRNLSKNLKKPESVSVP